MKKNVTRKTLTYTIDLTEIEGDGAFPCPKCGTIISPEDETEKTYKVIDTKVRNNKVAELVLECNICGCISRLTGFLSPIDSLASEL